MPGLPPDFFAENINRDKGDEQDHEIYPLHPLYPVK